MKIIGRIREQGELQRFCESKHPEFIAVYGRRRVGKTFLIREYFNNEFAFYATGLANGTARVQLRNFRASLAEYGGCGAVQARDWFEAFDQLKKLLQQRDVPSDSFCGKQVVFMDEMPWFDTPRSDFKTALELFWNSWGSTQPRLLLVVCGSATSWVVDNLLKDRGGLHNRITGRMRLEPFTLAECEAYYRDNAVSLNRYQILESMMIFGGIPYYLNLFDRRQSLAQNVDRLCFSRTAQLKDEFDELYKSLFKNAGRHIAIVRAVARRSGGLTRDEIISATDLAPGGTLTKTLEELEQCGFLRKYRDFTRKKNGFYYQLVDPFTLFHLRFMQDDCGDDERRWSNFSMSSGHRAWSGLAFEQVCLAHLQQMKQKLGISGVSAQACSWRSKKDGAGGHSGAQIDLLIDRADGVVNVCEMKYSQGIFAIDKAYDERLRNKCMAFAEETSTKKALHLTLVTTYGITHNSYWNSVQCEITADDLFASAVPSL